MYKTKYRSTRLKKLLIDEYNKQKVLITSIILSILILLFLDLFYIPNDANVKIMCYTLMGILATFAFLPIMLFVGGEITEESKRIVTYGKIYLIITLIQIAVIIFRIGDFAFKKINLISF